MLWLAEIAENLIERIFYICKMPKKVKKKNFRHEILSKATELGFTKITGKDEFVELSQTGMCNNFSYK